ncbi:hypothetical protein FCV25MIE_24678 [Fagus crenata]
MDDTVSPTSTCISTSRMEATPPRSMPFVKASLKHSSPSTRSMLSVRALLRHSSPSTRSYGSRPTSPSSSLLVATIAPCTLLIL